MDNFHDLTTRDDVYDLYVHSWAHSQSFKIQVYAVTRYFSLTTRL